MPDGQRRRLVIDANILIRAALGRRVKETHVSHAEAVDFFPPTSPSTTPKNTCPPC
ncbi:MAG TPA: hypothetical protein PLK46_06875 [Propioniciclava sp.]|uniref:hypothetical protein n=1 Tax=Propioniciclava sp. TaxID=2038686 RepID=UPI002CA84B3D|nr:hypothetical protein [Propioniciclava sp.]HRL80037.1 hypothetical protein [Propioniciclava sp.]